MKTIISISAAKAKDLHHDDLELDLGNARDALQKVLTSLTASPAKFPDCKAMENLPGLKTRLSKLMTVLGKVKSGKVNLV